MALASFTPPFAPTSCVVYRGVVSSQLDGNLFFGGYVDGRLRRVYFDPSSNGTMVDSIVTFHHMVEDNVLDVIVGNDGKLWFSTQDAIYRIDPPGPTAVTPPSAVAHRLRLAPNPFVGSVTIALDGPHMAERIEILDLVGRRVRRWESSAATVHWDGRDESGRDAASGVYVVRVFGHGRISEGRIVKISRR